jgi:hypothetical protein
VINIGRAGHRAGTWERMSAARTLFAIGAFAATPACDGSIWLGASANTPFSADSSVQPVDAGEPDAVAIGADDASDAQDVARLLDAGECRSIADCPANSGAVCPSVCIDGTDPCVSACVAGRCAPRGCPDAGDGGDVAPSMCVGAGLCPAGQTFDSALCACTPTADAQSPCVQTGICPPGDTFDHALCFCVPEHD